MPLAAPVIMITFPVRDGRSFSVKAGAGGNRALLRPTMMNVGGGKTLEMNTNLEKCFNLGQ